MEAIPGITSCIHNKSNSLTLNAHQLNESAFSAETNEAFQPILGKQMFSLISKKRWLITSRSVFVLFRVVLKLDRQENYKKEKFSK